MLLAIALITLLVCFATKATAGERERKLEKRAHHQRATLHADRGSLRFCRRHPQAVVFCTPRRLRFVRARIGWTTRELAETLAALRPRIPHLNEWLCIHSYEGSWTDPGAPFYGGLQMDIDFQQTWGSDLLRSKGTADHWTPAEQMMVAERAWKHRGFWPWPNTARYCGLL